MSAVRSDRWAFDVDDPVLAAAAWSRLAEPGDAAAGWLVRTLGAPVALRWLAAAEPDPDAAVGGLEGLGDRDRRALHRAVQRFGPRLAGLDPRRELRVMHRIGGRLLVPGQDGWPVALDDLADGAPPCLWVRGRVDLDVLSARAAFVVGARAASGYGEHVAVDLGAGLAERGVTVVSGGAYGIDAAAHRGALAAGGPTVAVLAGGVDRLYPAGNTALLEAVLDSGAVVSEVPPGSAPTRSRFLERNRLIAAFAGAGVVVEAAWRSGALSTAHRAADLMRPLGAVPGPVTSMVSAGCHRLLREGLAVCVTDAAEVVELLDPMGVPPETAGTGPSGAGRSSSGPGWSDLDAVDRRALDAVPVRRAAGLDSIARAAGLSPQEAGAALGRLVLAGLVEDDRGGWRLHRSAAR